MMMYNINLCCLLHDEAQLGLVMQIVLHLICWRSDLQKGGQKLSGVCKLISSIVWTQALVIVVYSWVHGDWLSAIQNFKWGSLYCWDLAQLQLCTFDELGLLLFLPHFLSKSICLFRESNLNVLLQILWSYYAPLSPRNPSLIGVLKAEKLIDLIHVMCSNIQLFMTAIKYIPQVSFFFPKCNFWNKVDNEYESKCSTWDTPLTNFCVPVHLIAGWFNHVP